MPNTDDEQPQSISSLRSKFESMAAASGSGTVRPKSQATANGKGKGRADDQDNSTADPTRPVGMPAEALNGTKSGIEKQSTQSAVPGKTTGRSRGVSGSVSATCCANAVSLQILLVGHRILGFQNLRLQDPHRLPRHPLSVFQ
jgi:hypothetical protein